MRFNCNKNLCQIQRDLNFSLRTHWYEKAAPRGFPQNIRVFFVFFQAVSKLNNVELLIVSPHTANCSCCATHIFHLRSKFRMAQREIVPVRFTFMYSLIIELACTVLPVSNCLPLVFTKQALYIESVSNRYCPCLSCDQHFL